MLDNTTRTHLRFGKQSWKNRKSEKQKKKEEELTKLKKALESTKQSDLENHKTELKELLEYEIVKRYYFEKGKVEVGFDDDVEWAKAKSILNNSNAYNNLLIVN